MVRAWGSGLLFPESSLSLDLYAVQQGLSTNIAEVGGEFIDEE